MARRTRKTLERSGTDRLTSGKLPLATPSTPPRPSLLDFAASPFRTTSLPPTQPRRDTHNRLPPPPPTYFQRATNSFPFKSVQRARTGSGPAFYTSRDSISFLFLARDFDEKKISQISSRFHDIFEINSIFDEVSLSLNIYIYIYMYSQLSY